MLERRIRFGLASVRPTEPGDDDAEAEVIGAFVHVFAPASDDAEFTELAAAALDESGYELVGLAEIVDLRDHVEGHYLSEELLEAALESVLSGEVRFGPFYEYASEEDEPDPRELLRAALRSGDAVRVVRVPGWDVLSGFVAGIGEEWVLLHLLDDGPYFDGHTAIRIADVRDVGPEPAYEEFIAPALELMGMTSHPEPDVDLDDLPSLLASLDRRGSLIVLHLEGTNPDTCYVGKATRYDEGSVELRWLSTTAVWEETEEFEAAGVTRVGYGGRYEEALALVAATRG